MPVTVLDGVVVVEVLLLVLLHGGAGRRLFGGKNVRCHLLLLLAPQSDNLITDWGQLGAAAGIAFLGALTRLAFHRLWKHQEERQTFHVPSLGIDHECVQLPSSGSARREDMHQGRAGAGEDRGGAWEEGSSWTALSGAVVRVPAGGFTSPDLQCDSHCLPFFFSFSSLLWRDSDSDRGSEGTFPV